MQILLMWIAKKGASPVKVTLVIDISLHLLKTLARFSLSVSWGVVQSMVPHGALAEYRCLKLVRIFSKSNLTMACRCGWRLIPQQGANGNHITWWLVFPGISPFSVVVCPCLFTYIACLLTFTGPSIQKRPCYAEALFGDLAIYFGVFASWRYTLLSVFGLSPFSSNQGSCLPFTGDLRCSLSPFICFEAFLVVTSLLIGISCESRKREI